MRSSWMSRHENSGLDRRTLTTRRAYAHIELLVGRPLSTKRFVIRKNTSHGPALLLMPQYTGTLAAARCLAAHGVPVVVASSDLLAPALWSRYVSTRKICPNFLHGPLPVLEWLMRYGKSAPGTVLYPTCDELAWIVARHRDDLAEWYQLYSPSLETLRAVLDKRELYAACSALGIGVPQTWYPETEADVKWVARQVPVCLVKPRTQVFFNAHAKGSLAKGPEELLRVWRDYRFGEIAPEILLDMRDGHVPMVQEYISGVSQGVWSVSGFIDQSGHLLGTIGSRKLLQLPREAGVGVCFKTAEVPRHLVDQVEALCRKLGYYGVFEVEFLRSGEQHLLIDFNPRYFGQMGFDIARGMELPWLAYLCATGQEHVAAEETLHPSSGQPEVNCFRDGVNLRWKLLAAAIAGAVSARDAKRCLNCLSSPHPSHVDAYLMRSDPGPGAAAIAVTLWRTLRYPRGFWKSIRPVSPEHASEASAQYCAEAE